MKRDRDLSCHKWSCKEEGKEALAVAAAPCGAVGMHRRSSHALSKVKVSEHHRVASMPVSEKGD